MDSCFAAIVVFVVLIVVWFAAFGDRCPGKSGFAVRAPHHPLVTYSGPPAECAGPAAPLRERMEDHLAANNPHILMIGAAPPPGGFVR